MNIYELSKEGYVYMSMCPRYKKEQHCALKLMLYIC